MPRETNREAALRRFDEIVRPFAGTSCFRGTTLDHWRRGLRRDSPEELVETARRMEKHARAARRRGDEERASAFDGLAGAHRLAASENASAGCCAKEHPGRLGRGLGERRESCARVSSCLSAFVHSEHRASAAHCPPGCGSFVPLARVVPTHRSTPLDQRASFSFGGAARTGIF